VKRQWGVRDPLCRHGQRLVGQPIQTAAAESWLATRRRRRLGGLARWRPHQRSDGLPGLERAAVCYCDWRRFSAQNELSRATGATASVCVFWGKFMTRIPPIAPAELTPTSPAPSRAPLIHAPRRAAGWIGSVTGSRAIGFACRTAKPRPPSCPSCPVSDRAHRHAVIRGQQRVHSLPELVVGDSGPPEVQRANPG